MFPTNANYADIIIIQIIKSCLGWNNLLKIGWNNLLSGILAFSWSSIISDHLVANEVSDKEMTPLVWCRRVVK